MHEARRGVQQLDVVVLMAILGLGTALLGGLHARADEKANRSRCANRLRQVAIAAISYSDDKRFFPRLEPAQGGLLGGPESATARRTIELLVRHGYADEVPVCPSSDDTLARVPLDQDPLVREPLPSLDQDHHLSYGWTRRAMNSSVRSTAPLAADRAIRARPADARRDPSLPPGRVGNHERGLGLAQADGSVIWIPASELDALAALVATDERDPRSGFLGIHDPSVR